ELCEAGRVSGYRFLLCWLWCSSAYVALLTELGECETARATGLRVVERCTALEIDNAENEIARPLALAEAALHDCARADERLRALLASQLGQGVTGVPLGAVYEASARVAIAAHDHAAFERYAELTAAQYRRGEGSALGARYERLLDEAERAGILEAGKL